MLLYRSGKKQLVHSIKQCHCKAMLSRRATMANAICFAHSINRWQIEKLLIHLVEYIMEKSIMDSSKTSMNSQRIRKYYTAETMFDGWKKKLASRKLFSRSSTKLTQKNKSVSSMKPCLWKSKWKDNNWILPPYLVIKLNIAICSWS